MVFPFGIGGCMCEGILRRWPLLVVLLLGWTIPPVLAELMAEDLGVPLNYVWSPQIMGFVRNTLELRVCDVMIGAVAGYEFVQNSNEVYRSVYALVVPASSDLEATRLTDPALQGRRIGVVNETPPLVPLRRTGAILQSYPLMVDTRVRAPVRDAIADVVAGRTEGAVLWGPLAGYYAALEEPPLRDRKS